MKLRILRNPVLIAFLLVLSSMFLVGDTIYLPLVVGGAGAATGEEVFVPAGTFQMGCFDDLNNGVHGIACPSDELPLHPVYLDDYYIDKYEVTNAQYKACVDDNNNCALPSNTTAYNDAGKVDHPVVYVDWNKAKTYCEWARTGGRLPTEAEWEKAARGDGYPRTYPWGEPSEDIRWANYNFSVGDTTAVGSYPAGVSPYGAHDMVGNVYEWVNDWYGGTYYDDPAAFDNPQGPDTGTFKVLRGGSWGSAGYFLRVASRSYFSSPTYSDNDSGFRCARTP